MTAGAVSWTLCLRRDATVSVHDGGTGLDLASHMIRAQLPGLGPGLTTVLGELAAGPRTEIELTTTVTTVENDAAALRLQLLLRRLDAAGWLEHAVRDAEAPLAVLRPLGHLPVAVRATTGPPIRLRLSRFALLRAGGGALVAESGRSAVAVELVDPRCAQLVAGLAAGLHPDEAAGHGAGLPAGAAPALLALLQAAGLVTPADATDDEEVADQRFAQWSAADLLMHCVSRQGRRPGGYGGSYPLAGRFPPLPALPGPPPASTGAVLPLAVPDLAAAAAADPPLTTALEARRSLRAHDDSSPITATQLGELLYRSARCRRTIPAGQDELVDRPYPAGGAQHELEIYPVVTACQGVPAGLWHYDTSGHRLEEVSAPTPAMRELVAQARAAATMASDPQVLLVVTARFGRVMWKYESIGYALILKHVGVLYQTLYLVATAMGLAPCGLGGGNADLFALASGLDYYREGSVGEFVVGSREGAP
ncbi:MAG: SagB/ThcOx family dehydrogenase [Mycobacteriales bacterium]